MKHLLLLLAVVALEGMAEITVTVPKKWKGKTLYIWQTDINQTFNRQPDELLNQVKDTVTIKDLTFSIPNKLNCNAKVNILTPAKNADDYDHTIAEACIASDEDVSLYLDRNSVRAEGSLLNQQMAEISSYTQSNMERYLNARRRDDRKEVSRIAGEIQGWYLDWIKSNPAAPGAGYALYQISNPETIVETYPHLEGDALQSMFFPYTVAWVGKAERYLANKKAQQVLDVDGTVAPDFKLSDLDGKSVALSDFRGKWVIIDFWGSWCSPCIKGMPELKEIYSEYPDRLEIIGVDCNDTEEAWRNAVTRLSLPWVSVYQPKGGKVGELYGVSAYPTKVVVTPEGKIKKIYSGGSPTFRQDLEGWLK